VRGDAGGVAAVHEVEKLARAPGRVGLAEGGQLLSSGSIGLGRGVVGGGGRARGSRSGRSALGAGSTCGRSGERWRSSRRGQRPSSTLACTLEGTAAVLRSW